MAPAGAKTIRQWRAVSPPDHAATNRAISRYFAMATRGFPPGLGGGGSGAGQAEAKAVAPEAARKVRRDRPARSARATWSLSATTCKGRPVAWLKCLR